MTNIMEIMNPPYKYLILLEWMVMAVAFLTGLILYAMLGKSLPLIGTTAVGALLLVIAYYRQYLKKPRSVTVKDDGVVLHFRFRADRFIPWDDIKGIYAKPGPEDTKWGKGVGEGGISLRSNYTFISVRYTISKAIIERYTEANGEPPDTWSGL